jgi:hypothetical protein
LARSAEGETLIIDNPRRYGRIGRKTESSGGHRRLLLLCYCHVVHYYLTMGEYGGAKEGWGKGRRRRHA